jgi:alkylation response protein AidB-like acyl-CoA dehydrogenase
MDFALTDDQKAVLELAGKIFAGAASPDAAWSQLAEANLLGVALRDDVGGVGQGLLELCALFTAAGAAAAPVPVWAVSIAALAIDHLGSDELRHAILPAVVAGKTLVVPAFSEPGNDDPRGTGTRVRADGRLEGVKTYVPAAPRAAHFVVPARRPDGAVALYLVAAADTQVEEQAGTTGEIVGQVTLAGAPAAPLGGPADLDWVVDRAAIGLCAMELGIVEHVLRLTASYTSQRVQFDRPIATFQAVAQRAADAYIDVESIRLTFLEAAWRLAEGREARREVAIAKFFAAEAGQRITYAAQHLHGGIGFDLDYGLARYYPLSKQIELTLGGANAQLARLGGLLAG